MGSVDLKVIGVVVATLGLYTLVANVIPQVQSEVPEVLAFGADVSAEDLVAAGDGLFNGAGGCTACHAESPGARAPNLLTDYRGQGPIGARCGTRIAGVSCKDYLHAALVTPTDHLVDEFPPIMPATDRTMSQAQIWSIVAYLEAQGGTVSVTGADIPPEEGSGGAAPGEATATAGAPAGPGMIPGEDPAEIVRSQCLACHVVGAEGGALGPSFNGMGTRLTAEQIRVGILDPRAGASAGFEALVQVMPDFFGQRLTATQLEAIVRYIAALPAQP